MEWDAEGGRFKSNKAILTPPHSHLPNMFFKLLQHGIYYKDTYWGEGLKKGWGVHNGLGRIPWGISRQVFPALLEFVSWVWVWLMSAQCAQPGGGNGRRGPIPRGAFCVLKCEVD